MMKTTYAKHRSASQADGAICATLRVGSTTKRSQYVPINPF